MRLAYEHYPKSEEKKSLDEMINRFLKNEIGFRRNEELETEDFPNINKKVFDRLN